MNITKLEIIILVLKCYLYRLLNWIYLVSLNYISDKYLIFVSNKIKYESYYDISDSSSDEVIESVYAKEYESIKDKFKINNIIMKYTHNRYMNYEKNAFYIIKSFLFNFSIDKVTEKYCCTKKLIISFNRFGCINTDNIKLINSDYKYIYIFYKNGSNNFHIKIIDMNNNIDIICNSELMFNTVSL